MSDFDDAMTAQIDAAFDTFGKDATWDGVPCRVRRKDNDETGSFSHGRAIMAAHIITVRASEIAAPAENNLVAFTGKPEVYRIIAEPKALDRRHAVWTCEAELLP